MNNQHRALSTAVRMLSLTELAAEYQRLWQQIQSLLDGYQASATPEQMDAAQCAATPLAQRMDAIRRPLAEQGYRWDERCAQWRKPVAQRR